MSSLKRVFAKVSSQLNGHKSTSPTPKQEERAISPHSDDEGTELENEDNSESVSEASEKKKQEAYEQDPLKENYGDMGDSEATLTPSLDLPLMKLDTLAEKQVGDHVRFRSRIHHTRGISPKIVFIVFRHQLTTIQGIVSEQENIVSENMVRWIEHLRRESIVVVEGTLQNPNNDQGEIKDATIHSLEVNIHKLYLVAPPTCTLPFQIVDASKPADFFANDDVQVPRVTDRTRLNNRILDLRTPTSQAIFRIHSGITKLFREFLDGQNFIEINTSKFQGSATESGASVFKVDYFRRPVYLAQSPQLAKQMCIAADMERVYEIGPVFRAENSNTHRHLTEFTGLDIEMVIESNYHEVLDVLDGVLLHIFRGLQSRYQNEIEVVKQQYPHDDLTFPEKTVRLNFVEGIKMLRESGWKEEDGSEPSEFEDLSTKAEQQLGRLVKEKYNTDYYILDKFPCSARPFYTMLDGVDQRYTNSFDIFLRGEEILSGGQRIHRISQLEERMHESGIDPDTMREYLDGFRWGCPPSLQPTTDEKVNTSMAVVALALNLGDIRWGSLFARDPKSFAVAEGDTEKAAQSAIVKGPTVLKMGNGELPPLENLIAKYGDATNTSWTDPAWKVWRHDNTGGAVGYIPESGYGIAFGNPLCAPEQMPQLIKTYLKYLKKCRLKPVWCCVGSEVEHYLADKLGWSAVMAVAEERLDPTGFNAMHDRTLKRKTHRAEREGVKVREIEGTPDEAFKEKVQRRLEDWQAARKGTQVHLTGLYPFDDVSHRRYFYATDKDGEICCLVVLAQLSTKRGVQIKWALEFPDAPSGAIECILAEVINKLGNAGVKQATFGAGATDELRKADNIGGFRFMILEKAYTGLARTFPLSGKGDFRQKFGVYHDPD
ncbi:hypothetical protein Clacol_002706 [Clathrus columnatus]|uniref:Probable aspartate--tRNA ligase, cytoplasmic n=1 Tax=Clathrus columnatus TaxID=1419009 RepID=A0AAV5A770_9AGAM|nr:hypothetical protein Clacol_002706 [Clathrus columnatus]